MENAELMEKIDGEEATWHNVWGITPEQFDLRKLWRGGNKKWRLQVGMCCHMKVKCRYLEGEPRLGFDERLRSLW